MSTGPTLAFCFGSNSVRQLIERVSNPGLVAQKALLPGYRRCFAGFSKTWGGAVASLIPSEVAGEGDDVQNGGAVGCRGTAVWLSAEEMALLDRFEGIPEGSDPFSTDPTANVYARTPVTLLVWPASEPDSEAEPQEAEAIAYIKNDHAWVGGPSLAYKEAIHWNLKEFWPEMDAEAELLIYDGEGRLRDRWQMAANATGGGLFPSPVL